jgi:protein-disulfide isomerase
VDRVARVPRFWLFLPCSVLLGSNPAWADVLAEIDGEPVLAEQVDRALGVRLSELQEEIYRLKKQKLDQILQERLLANEARRRGISVAALLDKEVTSKVGLVTEREIEAFYRKNKARMPGDEGTVRQRIRSYLQQQKLSERRAEFIQALAARSNVVIHLKPPPQIRVEVGLKGAPFKGPADAPVTIVKFEDFQCPFCKRAQETFAQLESKYKSRLKIVHKDFPIDSLHPQARRAHEAARCASEQGKFWPYHDRLYAGAPKFGDEDLKTYAKAVKLNLPAFANCLATGRYKDAVQRDYEEGSRLGITGTPTFFINGRYLNGAQPPEVFARIIEEELASLKQK